MLVALGVELGFSKLSPVPALLLLAGWYAVWLALFVGAGSLVDRSTPAFRGHPDRVIFGAVRPMSSADLESEILDADCGYHVHLGSGTSEQPWAASPLAGDDADLGVGFSCPQDCLAELAPQLLNEAGVAHIWEERGNIVRVVIPRIRASGFDVTVEAASFGLLVRTGALFHAHFPWDDNWDYRDYNESEREEFRLPVDPDRSREPAEQALALVRDLLSPAVRIRERRAAGISYYAALEVQVSGQWRRRRAVVLLRYPYWGKREERVWANAHLDPRTAETVSR